MNPRSTQPSSTSIGRRSVLAVGVLVCLWGCESASPAGPSPRAPEGPTYEVVETYDRVTSNPYGQSERYDVLSDGRFRLRFLDGERLAAEFTGHYVRSTLAIAFAFDDSDWRATGVFGGDFLRVTYNAAARMDEFEDGVFVRSAAGDRKPGTIEVSVVRSGAMSVATDTLAVVGLASDGPWPLERYEVVRAPGGVVRFSGVVPGTYWVYLSGFAHGCFEEERAGHEATVESGDTLRFHVDVTCESFDVPAIPGSVAGVYERTTPHSDGTSDHHGSLSERYVLLEDGTFRLQFDSARWGFFQYPGTYAPGDSADELLLAFDDNAPWWDAHATLRDGCLIVEYNLDMVLSDFEDGQYCRS